MALEVSSLEVGPSRQAAFDPVRGGSANAYDYSGQDPVNKLDLDGRIFGGFREFGAGWNGSRGYNILKGGTQRITRAAAHVKAAVPRVTRKWNYQSGGRMVAQVRWGGGPGRRQNFVRLDHGGPKHTGYALDVRIGRFRMKHWTPWKR